MALFFNNGKQGVLIRHILLALFVFPGAFINLTSRVLPFPATAEIPYYHDHRMVNELYLAPQPSLRINLEQNSPHTRTSLVSHQTGTFRSLDQFQALQAYNSLVLHQIRTNEMSCLCLRSCITFLQLKNIWRKCADDYTST